MSDESTVKEVHGYDELYAGRFIKASQFKGRQVTLTIADVWTEELEGERGTDRKAIVTFKETDKQHVMPKINGVCLKAMFGGNVKEWFGRRVTFYPTADLMPMPTARGDDRYCVRVFGSPDISTPVPVEFRPPKRRAIKMVMQPTGKREAPAVKTDAKCDPAKWRKKLRAQAGECHKKGGGGADADAYYYAALRIALGAFKEDDVHLADMTDEQALRASQVMGDHVQGVEPLL